MPRARIASLVRGRVRLLQFFRPTRSLGSFGAVLECSGGRYRLCFFVRGWPRLRWFLYLETLLFLRWKCSAYAGCLWRSHGRALFFVYVYVRPGDKWSPPSTRSPKSISVSAPVLVVVKMIDTPVKLIATAWLWRRRSGEVACYSKLIGYRD